MHNISDFFNIFDYSSPDMARIGALAADKRYDEAKEALLAYFVERKKKRLAYSEPIEERDKNPALAYLARHFILPGPNDADVYLSSIFVTKASDAVSLDIMPFIKKHLSFMIMSRQKEDAAAFFFSPRSIFPPKIVITASSGREITVHCSKYAYIATSEPDSALAEEDVYEIREESSSPGDAYGMNTGRCYLAFDLTGVERSEIKSARLSAKVTLSEGITKKELLLFNVADSSWDNSLTWNGVKGNVYSWESSPTGPSWEAVPYSDSEYLNVICRFNFARAMAYQYLSDVEKNTVYGDRLVFLMRAFASKKKGGFNRVLETGERLSNFTAVLGALLGTPALTADALCEILYMIYRDIKHLVENPDLGWSNWGVVRTSGLSKAIDFLPELKSFSKWRMKTRAELEALFDKMYSPDFSFRESGFGYSFWCVELFAGALRAAEGNNDPYSAFMRGKVERALDASLDLIYPNFYDTNIGDSNYCSKLGYLKKLCTQFPTKKLTAFLKGGDAAGISLSNCYYDANLAVMRTSFDPQNASHIVIHASPFDGHAHSDLGSLTFYSRRRPLITDNGRYGYSDSDISAALKEPTSHNSVEIEGAIPLCHSAAKGKITAFSSNSAFDFVKLVFNPYEGVRQVRSVFFEKEGGFAIVSDVVTTDRSARRFNQNWNFLPYSEASADFESRVETHFPTGSNIKLVTASCDTVEIRKSVFSAGYGVAAAARRAVFTKYGQNASFVTLLLPFSNPVHASGADMSEGSAYSAARFTINSDVGVFYSKNTSDGNIPGCVYDGEGLYLHGDAVYIAHGKSLSLQSVPCVESGKVIPDMYLKISGGIVEIESSTLHSTTSKEDAVKIYAPKTTHVILNGTSIPFTLYSDYIYAVGV